MPTVICIEAVDEDGSQRRFLARENLTGRDAQVRLKRLRDPCKRLWSTQGAVL